MNHGIVRRSWPGLMALALVTAACGGSSPTSPTAVVQPTTPDRPMNDPTYTIRYTNYLAFGDSFTEGVVPVTAWELALVSPDGYPAKLEAMLRQRYTSQPVSVVSSGLPGERVDGGLERLSRALEQNPPHVLLLLEGVNDLNGAGTRGIPKIVGTLGSMVTLARNAGVQVLVATLPPQRPGGSRAFVPEAIVPFNTALQQMATAKGATVVDLYSALASDLTYIGADGLHPTLAGYERMAQAFYDTIRLTFEVSGTSEPAR